MLEADCSERLSRDFLNAVDHAADLRASDHDPRALIRNGIYTIQQCIGAALDALPAGRSNAARKINGDLFERCAAQENVTTGSLWYQCDVPARPLQGVHHQTQSARRCLLLRHATQHGLRSVAKPTHPNHRSLLLH